MTHVSRRAWLIQIASGATGLAIARSAGAQAKVALTVYKDPSCGCCHNWVQYMAANGFQPRVTDVRDMTAIKTRYKIAAPLQSCHTAIAGTYVIEGHVPAADVKRLLLERPPGIVGLTIPGMPASAPGMDGRPFVPYTVSTFDAKGATSVFARHTRV